LIADDIILSPLGKAVVTITYVDANLYHDLITGHVLLAFYSLLVVLQLTGTLSTRQLWRQQLISQKFGAARISTDQVIDLCNTLHYHGVPVKSKSYMFGDNKSVVTSATIPHSGLIKCHNALSYHCVHESIAARILGIFHIDGKKNPADVLSKHGGFLQIWPLIKPLLFWHGDMPGCIDTVTTKLTKPKQD